MEEGWKKEGEKGAGGRRGTQFEERSDEIPRIRETKFRAAEGGNSKTLRLAD